MRHSRSDRFWGRVDKRKDRRKDGCWLWTGPPTAGRYGRVWIDSRPWLVHRYAYTIEVGPIPEGLTIDHLCRNPLCVRPSHLEAVTHAENVRRGRSGAMNREKTHCPAGHPYSEANTHIGVHANGRPHRQCRACGRIRAQNRPSRAKVR